MIGLRFCGPVIGIWLIGRAVGVFSVWRRWLQVGIFCKYAALEQGIRKEELQLGFYKSVKLPTLVLFICTRAGILTEEAFEIGVHLSDEDHRINCRAVLHGPRIYLATADDG
jgi:hypothetical protein